MTAYAIFADTPPPKPAGGQDWVLKTISETHQGVHDLTREVGSTKANQSWVLLGLIVIVVWLIVITLRVWGPMARVVKSYEEHERLKQDHETFMRLVRGYFGVAAAKESKAAETLDVVKEKVIHTAEAVQQMKAAAQVVKQVVEGNPPSDTLLPIPPQLRDPAPG